MVTAATTSFRIVKEIDGGTPSSIIAHNDTSAMVAVNGRLLEAQFSCDSGFVIFMSNDCPFEERLYVYLLDASCVVIDVLQFGIPYQPGVFRDVAITSSGSITFSFFDTEERFVITVKLRRSICDWKGRIKLHVQALDESQ